MLGWCEIPKYLFKKRLTRYLQFIFEESNHFKYRSFAIVEEKSPLINNANSGAKF